MATATISVSPSRPLSTTTPTAQAETDASSSTTPAAAAAAAPAETTAEGTVSTTPREPPVPLAPIGTTSRTKSPNSPYPRFWSLLTRGTAFLFEIVVLIYMVRYVVVWQQTGDDGNRGTKNMARFTVPIIVVSLLLTYLGLAIPSYPHITARTTRNNTLGSREIPICKNTRLTDHDNQLVVAILVDGSSTVALIINKYSQWPFASFVDAVLCGVGTWGFIGIIFEGINTEGRSPEELPWRGWKPENDIVGWMVLTVA